MPIRFVTHDEGGKKAFLSIHPKDSSRERGLKTDVRPEVFSSDYCDIVLIPPFQGSDLWWVHRCTAGLHPGLLISPFQG